MTVDGAAMRLGKSKRQVLRYMADERLRSYRVFGARDRLADRLLWVADVNELRDALRRVKPPTFVDKATGER